MDQQLYKIVEYILNIADPDDLEVIRAALEKRSTEKRNAPVMGVNPAKLAAQTTDTINSELESSKKMVHKIAADFAADIIRKNAPELNEAQVNELLAEFLPRSASSSGSEKKRSSGKQRSFSGDSLPAGMIIQMVQQFVDYSEGSMSPGEQVQMENEIPGWKDKYWRSFPGQVQKLLSLYLNREIEKSRFESHLYEVLGL